MLDRGQSCWSATYAAAILAPTHRRKRRHEDEEECPHLFGLCQSSEEGEGWFLVFELEDQMIVEGLVECVVVVVVC